MVAAVREIWSFAFGAALSPLPFLLAIILLFTARARSNASAFLTGWVLGLSGVVLAAIFVGGMSVLRGHDGDTTGSTWFKIVLGSVLGALGVVRWLTRASAPNLPGVERFLAFLHGFRPSRAFALGVMFSVINPKNAGMSVGAGATISQMGLSLTTALATAASYVAIGTIPIGTVIAVYFASGRRAGPALDRTRSWMETHHVGVTTSVLFVMCAVFLGEGLTALQ